MSAGFEILRPDGTAAVSSFYSHYRYVKKIRGSGNFWDTSGHQYSDNVIVAFRTLTKEVSANRFSKGSWRLWNTGVAAPTNATLSFYTTELSDVYIFDTVPVNSSIKAGVQVFNPEGQVTFDSSYRYLRIIDVVQAQTNGAGNLSEAPRIYTGMQVACIPLVQAIYSEGYRDGGEQYYGATWEYAYQNEFRVVYVEDVYDWNSQNYKAATKEYLCLIIDVTHLDVT